MQDRIVRCLMLVACIFAGHVNVYAQEKSPANRKASLQELVRRYQATADSKRSGIEFTLKLYNDEFLIDPQAPKPESSLIDPTYLRAIVTGDRIKIEGYSFPLIYVKPDNSFSGEPSLMYFADLASRAEGWQEALNSRFTRPVVIPERQRYVIVSDQKSLTQFWKADEQNYPKAVVFPVENLLDRRLPVEHLLAELMGRPERLAAAVLTLIKDKEFHQKQSLSSVPQVIFEEVGKGNAAITQPLRIFLNPQRNHAITRVVVPEAGAYRQYDVMFEDAPEKSFSPTRCSVYVGAANGDVLGYAEITRLSSKSLESVPPREFEVEFPVGTYLADFTTSEKQNSAELAFVTEGGGRTVIDRKHLWNPEITYEKLLAADHAVPEKKSFELRPRYSQRRWLTTLLRWPWNLVTVVGVIVAGGVIRQGYKTLAAASSKPEGDQT
jgi:hypothetical protein